MEPNGLVIKARGGKWTIAYWREIDGVKKWKVFRHHGTAFALTPEAAVDWAYSDNSWPNELFKTKKEATEYLALAPYA